MKEIADMYTKLKSNFKKIVWVARPAAYDWQWLNNYYKEFGPKNKPNIGFKADCISTMSKVYAKLKKLNKQQLEEEWKEITEGFEMTHNSLDDAKYQAALYLGLWKRLLNLTN